MRSDALALILLAGCSSKASRDAAVAAKDATAAATDAAPPAATADASHESYGAAMARGRERMAVMGDAIAAVGAFEAALAARPDDARALSELSWAAFVAGDLVKARAAAERSIAGAPDPKLKAASLYNLGRVHEANRDATAALEAYRASLALRPHREVEARVRALTTSGWSEQVVPLTGPHADAAAYCAALGLGDDQTDDAWCRPSISPISLGEPVFLDMGLLLRADTPVGDSIDLGVRTAAGWWWLVDYDRVAHSVDIAHGRVVLWASSLGEPGSQHLTVCGVGASGTPACLGPVMLVSEDFDYGAELTGPNTLVVTAVKPDVGHDLAGTHRLVFP